MSFTRFNYDPARTVKLLQESTGPGRYILNTPGPGSNIPVYNDPQVRLQSWGGNLDKDPVSINNDLTDRTRPLSKYCTKLQFPYKGVSKYNPIPTKQNSIEWTSQSRATNPAFLTRDLEQTRWYPLFLNPQENVCKTFHNNINTRLLERDYFTPKIPCQFR